MATEMEETSLPAKLEGGNKYVVLEAKHHLARIIKIRNLLIFIESKSTLRVLNIKGQSLYN